MPLTVQKNSAFSPFAEYSLNKNGHPTNNLSVPKVSYTRTTFAPNPIPANPAPVELIHSHDSLQALPFGASAFKPIKQMSSTVHCSTPSMSSTTSSLSSPSRSNNGTAQQQPLRIPQPPRHSSSPSSSSSTPPCQATTRFPPQRPSAITSTSIKPQIIGAGGGNASAAAVAALNATRSDLTSKTHSELVAIARQNQQQIDANRLELEERQKLIMAAKMQSGVMPSMDQLKVCRQNIARDERELAQLSAAQRQAKIIAAENDKRRSELMGHQEVYAHDGQQLRHAVEKVDSLKKQVELLYLRRASAASAAIAQQRQINAFANQPPSTSAVTSPQKPSTLQFPQRPQASVVPFQIQKPMLNSSSDSEKLTFDQLDHPPASGKRLPQRNVVIKRPEKPPPPPKRDPNTVSIYGTDMRLLHNGVERPMPPVYANVARADYYKNFDQGALVHGRTDQLSLRNDSMKSLKRRSLLSQGDTPEADIFRLLLEEQKKGKTHISFNDLHHEKPPQATTMNVNGVIVNLRSAATQPRPPPTAVIEEPITPVAPQPPILASVKVSVSPQRSPIKKPSIVPAVPKDYSETSINTDPSVDELVKQAEEPEVKKEEPKVVLEAVTAVDSSTPEESENDDEEILKRELEQHSIRESPPKVVEKLELQPEMPPSLIEVDIEQPQDAMTGDEEHEIDYDDDEEVTPQGNFIDPSESSSSSADDEGSSNSEVPVIFDEPATSSEKLQIKGILRPPGKPKHNKRIVFDPFVLFLDGALEGQLDTVKENAAKIDDVSRPNDEGITALHNAICACHYEIVKFLVEAGADVNALDSDGWSPLHCAASCNNLMMLKLLVENGASIYATTLSDSETPIKKCEEKEQGYEQCINYLSMCDAWAGIINDRRVYPFYAYEAENDDELSFSEGEVLSVISRDNHGDLWWLCESMVTGKRGLAPANFFGIYPTSKQSQRLGFKRFEIPATPPTDNNNTRHKNEEKLNINGPSNFEKSFEISANA